VEVLPLSTKYFRQFQKKEIPSKVPIEKGIKAENILDRILEGEMIMMLKEVWVIALSCQTAI